MSEPVRDPRHNGSAAETLSQCLQAIESGQATLESCVAAHPEFAELEDLLRAVSIVQELPRPLLPQASKVAMRGQVLTKYRASARPVRSARKSLVAPRWFRVVLAASLILAILLGGGAGLVRAADEALPGDSLYGVKRLTERVQLSFADTAARSVISYGIAERRLAELTALAARNQPINDEFLTDVTDSVNVALAVQPDMAQRASLVVDVTKAIDQAQSSGAINVQAKEKVLAKLAHPPAAPALPPAVDPTEPQHVNVSTSVPSDTPTVQVASPTATSTVAPTATPTVESSPTPTTEEPTTPTEIGTETVTPVEPLIAITSTPTDAPPTTRPTVVKPRPTRVKATPNNPNGNNGNGGNNADGNGNANGNNAGGNGNSYAGGGNSNAGGGSSNAGSSGKK
jgi:uncharacterized membrane protein YgcG